MNYDTLKIEYRVLIEKDDTKEKYVTPFLWINDELISEGLTVNIWQIVESLKGSGQFEILTCKCGETGCIGIWEGIIVLHESDTIKWLIPEPIIRGDEPDEDEKKGIQKFRDKYFFKADYRKAVASAVEEAKNLILEDVENTRTMPYRSSVEAFLKLVV